MILIKSPSEIETMRQGGKILARILKLVAAQAQPGITTKQLDNLAETEIIKASGQPAFKGYHGFRTTLCTCLNSEVVHAPARPSRTLQDGDLLSIDIGMRYPAKHGLITDTAITIPIGKISPAAKKILNTTKKCLDLAIKTSQPNIHLGDVSAVIENHANKNGFNVTRELVGHGVGKKLHEEPQIPNYGSPGTGPILKPGMTLAIEPMLLAGGSELMQSSTGAYQTADEALSAHFEHTILITPQGNEILTK